MRLQNKEYAYVPLAKLLDYLLSETHPVGKSKAKYLRSLGFNEINVNLLKEGLLAIARSEDVKEAISSYTWCKIYYRRNVTDTKRSFY
ncbi:MAG: DUF6883 domain-containing protein [Nitrospirota bacterium]